MESSRESDSTSLSSDSLISQTSRPKGEIAGAKAQSLPFNNIEKMPSRVSSELTSVANAGNAQDQDETKTRYVNAAVKRERNRVVPVRKLAFVNNGPAPSRTTSKKSLTRTVSKKGSKSHQFSSGASHASSASDTSTTVGSAETNREQKMQAREVNKPIVSRTVVLGLLLSNRNLNAGNYFAVASTLCLLGSIAVMFSVDCRRYHDADFGDTAP